MEADSSKTDACPAPPPRLGARSGRGVKIEWERQIIRGVPGGRTQSGDDTKRRRKEDRKREEEEKRGRRGEGRGKEPPKAPEGPTEHPRGGQKEKEKRGTERRGAGRRRGALAGNFRA